MFQEVEKNKPFPLQCFCKEEHPPSPQKYYNIVFGKAIGQLFEDFPFQRVVLKPNHTKTRGMSAYFIVYCWFSVLAHHYCALMKGTPFVTFLDTLLSSVKANNSELQSNPVITTSVYLTPRLYSQPFCGAS
jgi:hypothetical protein